MNANFNFTWRGKTATKAARRGPSGSTDTRSPVVVRVRPLLVVAILLVSSCLTGFGQEEKVSEAEKLARSLDANYIEAYNKGDTEVLAGLYAEDAQVSLDDNPPLTGKKAVMERLSSVLKKNPGIKLELTVASARFLTPDVLVERGSAAVEGDLTQYLCTYTKKGTDWVIAEIQEVTVPASTEAEQALGDLAWMVGQWKDKNADADVASVVDWSRNGNFLRRAVTISVDGEVKQEATELIGFDPVAGRLRSWIFDSDGGFGEGFWVRDGSKWLLSFRGTAPDGGQSSAQHVMTYIDKDTFTWESYNRQLDGEVLPAVDKTTVVRVPAQKTK